MVGVNTGQTDDPIAEDIPGVLSDVQQTVSIVTSKRMEPDFPTAARQALGQRGHIANIYRDGDPEMLRADVILLMGSLASLRSTAKLLRAKRSNQLVVGWVSEPLPPKEITGWALTGGLWLCSVSNSRGNLRHLLNILSWPFYLAVVTFGLGKYSGSLVNPKAARFAINNFAWIRNGYSQGWITEIGCSTQQKVEFCRQNRIQAFPMPVGQQNYFGKDCLRDRPIDVVFIGRIKSARRKKTIAQMSEDLKKFGLNIKVISKGLYGDARTKLLNRTRVVIHLHTYPWDTPWMRWNLASANGAAVASETLSVPTPFTPNVDFLSADIATLGTEIRKLLLDEPRRIEMVRQCKGTIEKYGTLQVSIDSLLMRISGK